MLQLDEKVPGPNPTIQRQRCKNVQRRV
jgi:hypothetical protein